MPDDKYTIIACKCGRKIRALIAELNKGIICPRCSSHIQKDIEEKDEHAEKIDEAIPGDAVFEKCPSCQTDARILYRKKYLARCPACSKFFLRKKNPEMESAATPGGENKTQEFTSPVTGEKINPPQAAPRAEGPENQEQAPPGQKEQQEGQGKIPPTEKQMNMLNSLGICGTPETSQEASAIILTVTRIIEDAVREYNISFHLFPNQLKSAITAKIANSELFPKIYFAEESLKYEDTQPFLEETIKDIELRKALKAYINYENFISANEYINGFAEYVYDLKLDPEVIKIMALKAFARGFGLKLKPFGNILYTSSGDTVKKLDDLDGKNLMKFYAKENKVNSLLEKLFSDSGFAKPESKNAAGCFFLLALPAALSIYAALQVFSR